MSMDGFGEICTSYRLFALLLVVSLIVAVSLLYESIVPETTYYIVSITIAYIILMRLFVEAGARTVYKLRVYREYSRPVVEGKPLTVKLSVYNPSIIPILYIEISDHYPSLFHLVKGFSKAVGFLPPKGSIEIRYVVEPRIGKHLFKGVEVVVKDILGLFSYKAFIPNSNCVIRVHPKPYPLPASVMRKWVSTSLGVTKSRLRGIGVEFLMLREYSYGDDYRFIDWKAYARLRRLYVKVFEREASLNMVILVDASPAMHYGVIGRTMLEETVRVVSGLVNHIVYRGDWVGLAIRANKSYMIPPGRGPLQYYRVLEALSSIEWVNEYPEYTIADLLKKSLLLQPKRTKTLFLVFMSLDPTSYKEKALDREVSELTSIANKLVSLNHSVLIVSPLPELYELEYLSGVEAGIYLASILKSFEATREYARKLRASGVNVIQVGPSSLLPRLIGFIERYRSVIT